MPGISRLDYRSGDNGSFPILPLNSSNVIPEEGDLYLSFKDDFCAEVIIQKLYRNIERVKSVSLIYGMDVDLDELKILLSRFNRLSFLSIHGMVLSDDFVRFMSISLPNLSNLKIYYTSFFEPIRLERFPSLEELKIQFCTNFEGLRILHCPNLKKLSLMSCKNLDIVYLQNLSSLQEFHIVYCYSLKSIVGLKNIQSLQLLKFGGGEKYPAPLIEVEDLPPNCSMKVWVREKLLNKKNYFKSI